MPLQNFGMTNKEYYGMLWYFLEWSITVEPVKQEPFGLRIDKDTKTVINSVHKDPLVLNCQTTVN